MTALNPSPELVRAALALRDLLRDPAHAGTAYTATATPWGVTIQGNGVITDGPGVADRGDWRTLRLGDDLDGLTLTAPSPLPAASRVSP